MRKIAILLLLGVVLVTGDVWAVPQPPQLSHSISGVNITATWSSSSGATGYTLYYAPYPFAGPQTIGSFDMGMQTSISVNLWDGAAFYIAVTARDSGGESSYSNIDQFTIKLPSVSRWEEAPSLGNARKNFAGGVIDRKIIVFGGESASGQLLNSTEIYNPASGAWTQGASNADAGSGVSNLSSAVVNGKLYVFGASNSSCSTSNFAQEYNPLSNLWRGLAPKPTTVNGSVAATYNGEIFLFGGWSGSCLLKIPRVEVEAFNPGSGTWRSVTTLPSARGNSAIAISDGKAYLMGGVDAVGNLTDQIIAYDFTGNSWTTSGLGRLGSPRSFPVGSAAPVVDGTIVLAGGLEGNPMALAESNLVESRRLEFYNPRSHTVSASTPLPEGTASHLPVVLDGDLFIIGGMVNGMTTGQTWRADVIIPDGSSSAASCDSLHLSLCTSSSTCLAAGGEWYNGVCQENACGASGYFHCYNGITICAYQACNGSNDCGDYSDESSCGTESDCCISTNGCPMETATSCADSCCCCGYGEICNQANPSSGCVQVQSF